MSASPSAPRRVALITGANKGIGLEVVKQLARADSSLTVLLGSRDSARGAAAVKAIGLPNVEAITIEVTDPASVTKAVAEVKTKFGGLDLLANNAGVFAKDDASEGNVSVVDTTLSTNYHAVIDVTQKFTPILRQNARVVTVASLLGSMAFDNMSEDVRKRFKQQTTIEGLNGLVAEFRAAFASSSAKSSGWPNSAYGVSKAAVIVATKIYASQAANGVTVAAVCPGWCQTDMTAGTPAPLTGEEGGSRVTHALTLPAPEKTNGAFYSERAVVNWE